MMIHKNIWINNRTLYKKTKLFNSNNILKIRSRVLIQERYPLSIMTINKLINLFI
jgi:hypothetical protein